MVPWNSIELEQQNRKFHGIPWNFVRIQSSMEFHGTFSILPSSMEFHGTFNFPQKSSIPWNLMNFVFKKIIFLNIIFGIWLMIRCYSAKISQKLYIWYWFQYRNSYFKHPSGSEKGARSAKMACCHIYIYPYLALFRVNELTLFHIYKRAMKSWNSFTKYTVRNSLLPWSESISIQGVIIS